MFPYNQSKAWNNYPIPQGFGFSGLSRDPSQIGLDYTSFTCGACHISRVESSLGTQQILVGAANTGFDAVQYRIRAVNTLKKWLRPYRTN